MTAAAVQATAALGLPLLVLRRPGWSAGPGDGWHRVPDMAAAAALAPQLGERAFLAIGPTDLPAFADAPGWFLLRAVDPPAGPVPGRHEFVRSEGLFTADAERALLREHRIEVVVCRDSGGDLTAAKLVAARELGLPVPMVDRPAVPAGVTTVATVEEAVDWLRALCPDAHQPHGAAGVEALQHLERGRFQRGGVGRRLRQRHAARLRRERREPHLDAHARGGPALGAHVLGDAVGERHGGRAHVRPVGEVGREGLLPPVRARDPRLAAHLDPADPAPQLHVPGAKRGPELGGERLRVGGGELVHGVQPALGELRRGLRADAPERPRRPVPHHLGPVLRGEREPAAGLPNSVAILARSRLSPIPTAQ